MCSDIVLILFLMLDEIGSDGDWAVVLQLLDEKNICGVF